MNNILSMQDIVKIYYMDDEDLGELKHINFLVGELEQIPVTSTSLSYCEVFKKVSE